MLESKWQTNKNYAQAEFIPGISGQYAAYIIAKGGDVTPLQLQKMLYYTQACFISTNPYHKLYKFPSLNPKKKLSLILS